MKKPDEIPTTNPSEVEDLIKKVENNQLSEGDKQLVARLLRLVLVLLRMVESKNTSISRLKRLLFGPRSEKRSQPEQPNHNDKESGEEKESNNSPEQSSPNNIAAGVKQKRPGHGRLSAAQYSGAELVVCKDESLKQEMRCPHISCQGRLYETKELQEFIRFEGRPLISATHYQQEVLRCSVCAARFAAPLPAGVPAHKYDESVDAMLALMKYGMGFPFYRSARLQELMGIPLPASTQFERCEIVAASAHPVFLELERRAACAGLLHGDDTGVKILQCLKENQRLSDEERRGLYTTGIGARAGEYDIALYYSGRRYCGENLTELLKRRPSEMAAPIIMGDAEAKNWTTEFAQIVAKCLAHARRKFIEIESSFPAQAKHLCDELAKIYAIEAETKQMSAAERLAHHRSQCEPIMKELRDWMAEQLRVREVEPNSSLGKAMKYFLRHYPGLTAFCQVEGAPLDNNFVERLLKRAVLNRKNALFYKTEHGAAVGDILMSIIETCALNKVNPFDYLLALHRNATKVRAHPAAWMPWNYRDSLAQAA